jgi:hypothetical protein
MDLHMEALVRQVILTVLIALTLLIGVSDSAYATCSVMDQDYTTVCATGGGYTYCWYQFYQYWYCEVGGGGGGDGGAPYVPSPGGGYPGSYYDANANGVIDHWRGVVMTSDPCANNFDANDRLGTDHGGTNTTRANHSGVDIQGNHGDPLFSAFDGVVVAVGTSGGCGYRIQIQNSAGYYTTYCHMVDGSSLLAAGDSVWAGSTQIGQLNSTGNSSGDHVHITHLDSNYSIAGEYFGYVDTQPSASELNAGGC